MNQSRLLSLSPIKMTGVYLLFGVLWIGTTDWLVITIFDSPETITFAQSIKGWIFVGLSALLLFGLATIREEQLNRSKARIETATEQLQVMHRVFRHNIRNDATVIHGYIDMVLAQLENSKDKQRLDRAREAVTDLSTTSEKITIIDDVDFTPSEEASIDIVDVVNDEVTALREQYPDVTITLSTPDSAEIHGKISLRHAIREILENAIEHNDQPTSERTVSITVEYTNDHVEVSVADNGPSIDDHEIEPLRNRKETALSHVSGVGLWLAIWLANRHNGDVTFDTTAEIGTTVTFEFDTVSTAPLIG